MGRFIFVTLSLLVVAFSINGAKGCLCPRDWLPMNGFCYKVFDDYKNWNDAEMFCRKHKPGCHLASLHGSDESLEVAEYVSDYLKSGGNVWIGLNDPDKQRNWEWTDRSRNTFWEWRENPYNISLMWKEGEPNNLWNKEYCVELRRETGYKNWNDTPCENLHPFLCQCKF